MGGSLAAALHRAGWDVVMHHRRPEVALAAQQRGWGQATSDPIAAMATCDLAVVCTPVDVTAAIVRQLAAANPKAVITDVGSVKGPLCRELQDLGVTGQFIGSHPMCGSHRTGLDAADVNLYQGAVTILTPEPTCPIATLDRITAMWQAVGSRIVRIASDAHDHAMVAASHLPHVAASAVAALLTDQAAPLTAGGFRDTTRIAAASPALWASILSANRDAVTAGVRDLQQHLDRLLIALDTNDQAALEAWLEAGRQGRARIDA